MSQQVQPARKSVKHGSASKRREMIFAAFRQALVNTGYSSTTLAEIAREAEMSPSHLLYYFADKADILTQYFSIVAERISVRLREFQTEKPEVQVKLLANLFFGGKGLSKTEIGVMLECFGVAVHLPSLKQCKSDLDAHCKSYLRDLFQEIGGAPADADYSAEVAYALLVGLRTAVYFDENLTLEQAHQIFRKEMMMMVTRLAGSRRTSNTAGASR